MKNKLVLFFLLILFMPVAFSAEDKYSKEYLQNKKHFAIINPITESVVQNALKKGLKKQTGADWNVYFEGYTTSSIKKGIFKHLELSARDFIYDDVPIKYVHLKSISDYNYIDYTANPITYKSDMEYSYDLTLTEESINAALKNKKYTKTINIVNGIAAPLFVLTNVRTKIVQNRLYIIMDYNFPLVKISKDRTFVASTNLKVENGQIVTKNVYVDGKYGNLGNDRVANLLNLLNPLEFTLKLFDEKKCNANIENVNIVDNNILVNGKIFVKGD